MEHMSYSMIYPNKAAASIIRKKFTDLFRFCSLHFVQLNSVPSNQNILYIKLSKSKLN